MEVTILIIIDFSSGNTETRSEIISAVLKKNIMSKRNSIPNYNVFQKESKAKNIFRWKKTKRICHYQMWTPRNDIRFFRLKGNNFSKSKWTFYFWNCQWFEYHLKITLKKVWDINVYQKGIWNGLITPF